MNQPLIDLQLFAAPAEDDDQFDDDEFVDENDELEDGDDDEEDTESEDTAADEVSDEDDESAQQDEEDDEPRIPKSVLQKRVKDRLERQARKFEREKEQIRTQAQEEFRRKVAFGVDDHTLKQAVSLWKYLEANPAHAATINSLLEKNPWQNHPNLDTGEQSSPEDLLAQVRRELDLRDTLAQLRQDPLYRKYEDEIRDYAEDEGFDLDNPRDVRKAYLAWRGENAPRLAANARLQGQRDASKAKKRASRARLQGSSGPRGARKVDPSKLSDQEFLAQEGLSLFTKD